MKPLSIAIVLIAGAVILNGVGDILHHSSHRRLIERIERLESAYTNYNSQRIEKK